METPVANQSGIKDNPFCALVALSENRQPSVSAIAQRVRELWPDLQPAADLVEDETGIGFALNGAVVVIVRMAGPIPLDPNDRHQPAVKAPLASAALEAQQAYLVIAVREPDPLQGAIAATEVTAAVVECCPHAIAVYWPAARQWIAPRTFVQQAIKSLRSRPPVGLWIDVRVWSVDRNTRAGFTRGLKALGHKEFEVTKSRESESDLRERLEGLCSYVLTQGPVLRDGHTVGHDENERIRIVFCRSAHGFLETVLRLDYDEDFRPRRPWWKLI